MKRTYSEYKKGSTKFKYLVSDKGAEAKYIDKALTYAANRDPSASNQPSVMLWTGFDGSLLTLPYLVPNFWYIGQSLWNIPQGQGASQRIGRKISPIRFDIDFGVTVSIPFTNVGASSGMVLRVIALHDKQYNGTIVTQNDIFEKPFDENEVILGNEGCIVPISAMPKIENMKRFTILHDKTFNIDVESNWANTPADTLINIQKQVSINKTFSVEIEQGDSQTSALANLKSDNVLFLWNLTALGNIVEQAAVVTKPDLTDPIIRILPYGWSRARYFDC